MRVMKIICAPNVSDEAFDYICKRASDSFKVDSYEKEIDPLLIGGFIVMFDGKVYDMSIKSQMDSLKGSMQSN